MAFVKRADASVGRVLPSEVWRMFKYPSMIKAAAFCAAVYGLLAVLLKNGIVLIPEVTEVRICNAMALPFGIFFGPAGAWGCAVGNLIGDMGGSLTDLSIFGFIANFFSAWFPYKAWCIIGARLGEEPCRRPSCKTAQWGWRLLAGGLLSVVPSVALLGVDFELTGTLPAASTFVTLGLNNLGATVLGAIVVVAAFFIPSRVLPYWRDIMPAEAHFVYRGTDLWRVVVMVVLSLVMAAWVAAGLCVAGVGVLGVPFGNMPLTIGLTGYCIVAVVLNATAFWLHLP